MKQKLIIALLSLYLIASTEFHQVLRLPLLVEHYVEHHELVKDMTFWEFLVMHYESDVAHDDQDSVQQARATSKPDETLLRQSGK